MNEQDVRFKSKNSDGMSILKQEPDEVDPRQTIDPSAHRISSGIYGDSNSLPIARSGIHGNHGTISGSLFGIHGNDGIVSPPVHGIYGNDGNRSLHDSGIYGNDGRISPPDSGIYGGSIKRSPPWHGNYGNDGILSPTKAAIYGNFEDVPPYVSAIYGGRENVPPYVSAIYRNHRDIPPYVLPGTSDYGNRGNVFPTGSGIHGNDGIVSPPLSGIHGNSVKASPPWHGNYGSQCDIPPAIPNFHRASPIFQDSPSCGIHGNIRKLPSPVFDIHGNHISIPDDNKDVNIFDIYEQSSHGNPNLVTPSVSGNYGGVDDAPSQSSGSGIHGNTARVDLCKQEPDFGIRCSTPSSDNIRPVSTAGSLEKNSQDVSNTSHELGEGATPAAQPSPWINSPSWTTPRHPGFRPGREPALPLIIFSPISTQPYVIDDVTDVIPEERRWVHYLSVRDTRGRDEEDAGEDWRDLEDMEVSSEEEDKDGQAVDAGLRSDAPSLKQHCDDLDHIPLLPRSACPVQGYNHPFSITRISPVAHNLDSNDRVEYEDPLSAFLSTSVSPVQRYNHPFSLSPFLDITLPPTDSGLKPVAGVINRSYTELDLEKDKSTDSEEENSPEKESSTDLTVIPIVEPSLTKTPLSEQSSDSRKEHPICKRSRDDSVTRATGIHVCEARNAGDAKRAKRWDSKNASPSVSGAEQERRQSTTSSGSKTTKRPGSTVGTNGKENGEVKRSRTLDGKEDKKIPTSSQPGTHGGVLIASASNVMPKNKTSDTTDLSIDRYREETSRNLDREPSHRMKRTREDQTSSAKDTLDPGKRTRLETRNDSSQQSQVLDTLKLDHTASHTSIDTKSRPLDRSRTHKNAHWSDRSRTSESVCPVCNSYVSRETLMMHVYDIHLPWYFSFHINRETPGYHVTALKGQLDPIIFKVNKCDDNQQLLIQKLTGCLIDDFLREIMRLLDLEGNLEMLLKYVKEKRLHLKDEPIMTPEEKFSVEAHGKFINNNNDTCKVSPPSSVSSLAHWYTLAKLLHMAGDLGQNVLVSYEKETAATILRRLQPVMPYSPPIFSDTELKLRIHQAVTTGNLCKLWQILENNPNSAKVDAGDSKKSPFLLHALGSNHYDCATALILHGASVNRRNKLEETPLKLAVLHNNHKWICFLRNWGPLDQLQVAKEIADKADNQKMLEILQKCQGKEADSKTSTIAEDVIVNRGAKNTKERCMLCAKPKDVSNIRTHVIERHLPWFLSIVLTDLKLDQTHENCTKLCLQIGASLQNFLAYGHPPYHSMQKIWGKLIDGFLRKLCDKLGFPSVESVIDYVRINELYPQEEGDLEKQKNWSKALLFYREDRLDTFCPANPVSLADVLHWRTLYNLFLKVLPEDRQEIIMHESYKWNCDKPYVPYLNEDVLQPKQQNKSLRQTQVTAELSQERIKAFKKAVMNLDFRSVKTTTKEHPQIVLHKFGESQQGIISLMVSSTDSRRRTQDMMRLLLLHGAPIDAKDKDGATALYAALLQRKYGFVALLIIWGASLSVRTNDRHDAWSIAFMMNMKNILTKFTNILGCLSEKNTSLRRVKGKDGYKKVGVRRESRWK